MPARDMYRTTVHEAPAGARPVVRHGLPQDIAGFTGRERELEYLLATAARGRVVNVYTVDGMPGVGKTALVTRAAHLLAERFPDGQFFYDLHAHTPDLPSAKPVDVLAVLLTDLGIDPQNLPPTLEGRSHLWRDRLTGKSALLVLDDAASHAQIEPLLPSTPGCLTLVTSRRLIALDGADPLALAPLTPGEAAELFTTRGHRIPTDSSEQNAVTEAVRLCGYLPLAIVLLAGRLRHKDKNTWSIARFAAEFAGAQDRLDELDDGGNRAVYSAFLLSYQALPADLQRLFRRIGLHPGPDLDAYAAAALDDAPLTATRRRLEALYIDHLLDEIAPGRYQPHDLLRAYARTLTTDHDPPDERAQATEWLLDYYQSTAQRADRYLARAPRPAPITPPPAAAPDVPDRASALDWMRTERANLLACLDTLTTNQAPRVIHLTAAMTAFLLQEGPWPQAAALHQRAATTARHAANSSGEANALNDLGRVRLLTGEFAEAARLQEQALALYESLGDRLGQAGALWELGRVRLLSGELAEAARLLEQALALYESLGDRLGQAGALNDLGRARQVRGEFAEATRLLEQALTLFQEVGDPQGEAESLNNMGALLAESTGPQAALTVYRKALELARQIHSPLDEARALEGAARCLARTGDRKTALAELREAVAIYERIGAADAQPTAEYLTMLDSEEARGASSVEDD
ncbi:tetratricopeptide repeat protein [Streptomyces sp. NPDC093510]|uniref:tetratricopeptide repeat protein n=1 Tax=Streptomyces sp. NPDC093510 TaxID=3155199 RepID=UPI00344AD104